MSARRLNAARGAVLFVTLILIVALMFGALALSRSVETASLISGNLGFKMTALHRADLAVERAVAELPTLVASPDASYPAGCATASSPNGCRYYPVIQPSNSSGAPAIDWTTVRGQAVDGYTTKYVVERLCQGSAPIADLANQCAHDASLNRGERGPDAPQFAAPLKLFYRVTVQVEGPRATKTLTQVVLSR
jgi:type IV pilus assembly protein PilX